MNTVTSQDFADVISLKIVNSNKKYDEVATKAFHNHILKEYHQFVYGVLNKDCLKMFITHNAFVSDEYGEDEDGNCGLTGKIEVHASVSEPSVFTHELGLLLIICYHQDIKRSHTIWLLKMGKH